MICLPLLLGVVGNALDYLVRERVVLLLRVLVVVVLVRLPAKDPS